MNIYEYMNSQVADVYNCNTTTLVWIYNYICRTIAWIA